jgi:hypothetical protein
MMLAGKMIYVDSTAARFVNSDPKTFQLKLNWLQTPLIKSVQTCMKLKMRLLTPLLALKITPMVAAIAGNQRLS